ncbi:hypothetical protein BOX15_Mlig001823g1 [Macrostomum lignano]|uniref:SUEL-type lectin domain-containing protein n=2 Tax=Macrostomum lignano TaxID=282301 RepID=A0A267F0C0_9PLAT|nr:hypothetical protein BOX15_Mlig001823g1 [Macrostomum lignano]
MRRQRLLPPILLLLALILLLLDCGQCKKSGSEHGCPPRSETKSACRTDGLQSVVITLYKWNPYLNRCQRNIQLKEVSCDKAGAKKGVCPEPRTVEPGSCNRRNNRQKTLVMHYEPDGKGGCVLHKDFAYPNCPKKKPGGKDDSDGCPEPRYYQKPCTGRHRQVFKFYYIRGKAKPGSSSAHECIEKTSINVEACGASDPAKRCPSPKVVERGRCKDGFRTLIRTEYSRDPAGKCVESSHSVTESCGDGETEEQPCPPNVLKQGPCVDGLRHITRQYYERIKKEGNRCVRKFSIENRPCGKHKPGVCPKPRVLEPGPCTDGRTRVLVAHYEPDPKTGRCKEQRTFTVKTCGKHKPKKTKDKTTKAEECPDKAYSQGPCKMGYRNLFTFSYTYSADLKRCIKHVALKREQCAALVATEACPSDDTVETGPCKSGFRTSILYHYSRNTEGHCQKNVKKVTSPCRSKKATECPPKRVKKVGGCEDRIQRWLTVYFEWNKLKGRCVKKFRAREKPCREAASGSTGAAKSKKCPKRRVMEPGPCIDGSRKVLVEHYEYSEKRGRCIAHRDFMHQKCGEKAKKKKKKSTPGVDLKHECPEKTVNQGACRKGGYRTVSTVYFVFVKALGRCVRKVKQEDEKCALLVKNKSCPADVTQEVGPCVNGYRTNIVYTFKRDLEGRCEKKSKKITITCSDEKAKVCPPKRVKKVGGCEDRIQRWLTVYFEWNKLKGRCVKKFRAREKPCREAASGSTGAAKSKKCPKRRVMEPGPCIDGSRKVLVEHYEYSEKRGRCIAHRDFMHQKCGEKAKKKKKKSTPGVDLKHECPEKTVNQGACRKGATGQ